LIELGIYLNDCTLVCTPVKYTQKIYAYISMV